MEDNAPENEGQEMISRKSHDPDEDIGIMVYGNLLIRDRKTGDILVNKRA